MRVYDEEMPLLTHSTSATVCGTFAFKVSIPELFFNSFEQTCEYETHPATSADVGFVSAVEDVDRQA